jgi:hypothetical protein
LAGEGFSAKMSGVTASGSTQIAAWSVSPSYTNANFDAPTGVYTAPTSGRYSIKATINYKLTSALSVSMGAGIDPFFVVRNITTSTDLMKGSLPILNTNIALLLTLRAVLGSGAVTLVGDVELAAGDQIGLFYEADGFTISLNIQDVVWSVHQLTD